MALSGQPPPPPHAGTTTATAMVRAAAISVKNARITYPSALSPVLDGLNMTVAEGTIYGLLGASGCGKTTLLTCIVGRRQLDEGSIRVLGKVPGSRGSGVPGPTVGYMPQELALHARFTVSETLRYFGWIAGMSRTEIEQRSAHLVEVLDVPFHSKLVGELSGGQQRRVSLGVALLHRPPILILDEPTVGVDPQLRQSIWDLLMGETKSARTTVIITTHYIEEARQSDTVGLMRNGTLLDEDSPDRLISRYGCATMEDVFLKLSLRQQRLGRHLDVGDKPDSQAIAMVEVDVPETLAEALPEALADALPEKKTTVVDEPSLLKSKPVSAPEYSNVLPCTWKMAVFTWRNGSVIVALLSLPIIIALGFGFAVGGKPKGLHLAVVNDDFAPCRSSPPAFPSDCSSSTHGLGLSCRYLGHLSNEMFVLDDYVDVGSAVSAVRDGRAWGAIHFLANYSSALVARGEDWNEASNETLDGSEIKVWLDMSNQQVSELARMSMLQSALRFFEDVQISCNGNPRMKTLPMQFNEPIYGGSTFGFPEFFAPAVILSTIYNVNAIYTMAGFMDDKKDGFMERSISSGVSILEILGAHVLIDTIMMFCVTGVTLLFMIVFLEFENLGSLWVLLPLCLINGYSGMFQGYFIASVFSSDFEGIFASTGIYFPTLLLSGLIWPLEGMHYTLRSAVWLLPLNLGTTAIRSIMNRGWGLDMPDVIRGFVSSLFWLAFFVAITVTTLRLKKSLL